MMMTKIMTKMMVMMTMMIKMMVMMTMMILPSMWQRTSCCMWWQTPADVSPCLTSHTRTRFHCASSHRVGRDDFQFFWNFITAIQILPCVIETWRYGYIRDSGGCVETRHGARHSKSVKISTSALFAPKNNTKNT